MTHGRVDISDFRPATALASARDALCGLWATHPWVWLARSGPIEASPAIGLVLLDVLSILLDAFGAGVCGHG